MSDTIVIGLMAGFFGLVIFQMMAFERMTSKYTEALENNTKALNTVREIMIHISSADGMHEKLLTTILNRLNKQ
jgi:hypothetical protein